MDAPFHIYQDGHAIEAPTGSQIFSPVPSSQHVPVVVTVGQNLLPQHGNMCKNKCLNKLENPPSEHSQRLPMPSSGAALYRLSE